MLFFAFLGQSCLLLLYPSSISHVLFFLVIYPMICLLICFVLIVHLCLFSVIILLCCVSSPPFSWSFFRDRLRTTTNVLGDSIGAGIVEHLSRHELQKKDPEAWNSVVEEADKKPYQLIHQENECENERPAASETKM